VNATTLAERVKRVCASECSDDCCIFESSVRATFVPVTYFISRASRWTVKPSPSSGRFCEPDLIRGRCRTGNLAAPDLSKGHLKPCPQRCARRLLFSPAKCRDVEYTSLDFYDEIGHQRQARCMRKREFSGCQAACCRAGSGGIHSGGTQRLILPSCARKGIDALTQGTV